MKLKVSIAAVIMTAAFSVQAQVEVVDSKPLSGASHSAPAANNSRAANANVNQATQLYFQLQTLQQEVQELRGLVEEQAYELKKVKQQRLDDYLDLDRRIGQLSKSGLSSAGSVAASGTTAAANRGSVEAALPSGPNAADEMKAYRNAIDLVIKKRDYDQAITALNQYLVDFPGGHYGANAKYWLGQIYLQKEELEQSAAWFKRVVSGHAGHSKSAEAKFKLGKVYHLQGKTAEAKSLLEEVVSSGGAAAGLAQTYLKQNF